MASLLLKNIRTVITCDDRDQVLEHIDIFCEDGLIRAMGPALSTAADEVIDCSGMLCYP